MRPNKRYMRMREVGSTLEIFCIHCKKWKPKPQMKVTSFRPEGVQSICKQCFAAYVKRRRADARENMTAEELAEHKRQCNKYMRQWYREKNPPKGKP